MKFHSPISSLLLAFALVALTTCGGTNSNSNSSPSSEGKSEAEMLTLRRGISAKVDTLDPHKSSAQWENIIITDMFTGLMTYDMHAQPVYGMAESHTVDDTGTLWTFNLKQDAVWSDGTPVTASDYVYSFRRILAPETASQYASLLYLIKNAAPLNRGELAPDTLGVTALDTHTLQIDLEYPAPYFLGLLTHYSTFAVPPHVVEAFGDAWIQPDNIVVNGPYSLKYWRTGDQLVTEKNPLWKGTEALCYDRITYFELEDLTSVERRIQAGDLDINNAFDGARLEELEAKLPGWPRAFPSLITTYWTYNTTQPPFDDVRVRQALSMALDREFMVDNVLAPGYLPAYNFVPPGIANYEADRPQFAWKDVPRADRLVMAKTLLEDAGFGPDNPLEFEYIHRSTDDNPKVAPVAQQNWNEIADWVESTPIKQDTKVLYARLRAGDFEVSDAAWVADFDDPINFLYLLDSQTGQQNYGNFNSPEFDRLLLEASNQLDLKKRAALFAQAEGILLEEAAISPMWFQVTKNMVDPNIEGYADNAQDQHPSRYMCPKPVSAPQ